MNMSGTSNIDEIPQTKLLYLMKRGIKDIKFNNKTYHLIGKGGEGNVYIYDIDRRIAIKVFHDKYDNYDPEVSLRELYVIECLKEIDGIQDHIVDVISAKIDDENGYSFIFMKLYDGDLDEWTGAAISTKISNLPKLSKISALTVSEEDWISMIFQIYYTLVELNERGVLHADAKPKNIFYENVEPYIKKYVIDDVTYEVPINTLFLLGDFSHVRIEELDPDYQENLPLGSSGSPDLIDSLMNRSDLYELSRIIYRKMVNAVLLSYTTDEIDVLVRTTMSLDPIFKTRIEKACRDIDAKFNSAKYGEKLKSSIINRAKIYELVETGNITTDDIAARTDLVILPSHRVLNILSQVINPDLGISDLFDFYIV